VVRSHARVSAEERLGFTGDSAEAPWKCFRSFRSLGDERDLLASIIATLRRVLIGFGLAAAAGIPLAIIADRGAYLNRRPRRWLFSAETARGRADSAYYSVVRHR